jgi:5-methylcytosine-specific restriction endonuclease McrA
MTRLAKSERCPIHSSYVCCGRKERELERRKPSGPVRRIDDPTEECGYREICSPAELRRRGLILLKEQKNICPLCKKPIEDMRDMEVDHKLPKGMNGGRRQDAMWNLQATHYLCNRAKGSIRNFKGAQ